MELKNGMIVIATETRTDEDGSVYFEKGKEYVALNVRKKDANSLFCFDVINDLGEEVFCLLKGCAHMRDGDWIIKNQNTIKMKNKELEEIIEKYDLVGKSSEEIFSTTTIEVLTDFNVYQILEYINLHYALPKSAITELSKDENVREILVKYGLVEENKLEVGKYYTPLNNYEGIAIFRYENPNDKTNVGWGIDYMGNLTLENYSIIGSDDVNFRLATPQEIKSMLIKKLEADGLKVGCKIESFLDGKIYEVTNLNYVYFEKIDSFGITGLGTLYKQGKFAKIIQLTLEQRIERLEKLNNL